MLSALYRALERKESTTGSAVISELIENAGIAANQGFPVCQDTGLAVVFIEIGQDVSLVNGSENMSGAAMLTPASGPEGVKQFVIGRVREAGANPCPPI